MFKQAWFYIHEFYRKGLIRFEDCQRHYAPLRTEDLLQEADLLCCQQAAALPFRLVFYRMYALYEAMVRHATRCRTLNDRARTQFINRTIFIKREIIRRCPTSTRTALEKALSNTCTLFEKAAPYPIVSDVIRRSLMDCAGPFRPRSKAVTHPGSAQRH